MPIPDNPLSALFFQTVYNDLNPGPNDKFLRYVDLDSTVDLGMQVHSFDPKKSYFAKLESYMGYVDIKGPVSEEKIYHLGYQCAGAYNALMTNAKHKGGFTSSALVYVPSLFVNNLKFHYATMGLLTDPTSQSIASYRFKFAYILIEE